MIFVTVGSQKFQFNRLLKAVDELNTDEEIFAQIGYSDYKPQNYKYLDFLNRDLYTKLLDKADIIITHGGTGAIINSVKRRKKVIAVPRLVQYGEHVDDHQIQIIRQFSEDGLVYECNDVEKLSEALAIVKRTEYKLYQSNTQAIIDSIVEFIEG